jgi:hypothetical protein
VLAAAEAAGAVQSRVLSAARCEKCNHALPLKGVLRDFRLPPDEVTCPGCGHRCGTIVPYRVGWMEALLHKLFAILSVPVSVYIALAGGHPPVITVAILVLGPVVGGGLGGLILGKLLGMPLTLLRDTRRRRK